MRYLLAALIVLVAACGDPGGAPSDPTTAPPTTSATAPQTSDGFPVTIDQTGGCFMMGPNCARYVVESDGTVEVYRLGDAEPELITTTTIDEALVDTLGAAVAATNLEAMRTRLGQGECQACYDGIDTAVIFATTAGTVAFNSADEEFDGSEPVFAALDAVIVAASSVEIPLKDRVAVGTADASTSIYAATVKQLVEVDNTFGGQPVFSTILVVDSVDPNAGEATGLPTTDRPLTDAERASIVDALGSAVDVKFIADADEYRTADLTPTIEGSAIVTVGAIDLEDEAALVEMSLWCGGVCGTWLTYRVVDGPQGWTVTEIVGPIAVS